MRGAIPHPMTPGPSRARFGGPDGHRRHPVLCAIGLLLFVANVADTVSLAYRGWFDFGRPSYAAVSVCAMAATALIAAATPFIGGFPSPAARIVCGVWVVSSCIPAVAFASSWTLMLDVLFAVAVVAYDDMLAGQVALDLCLVTPLIGGAAGGTVRFDHVAVVLFLTVLICLNVVMAVVAVMSARRRGERERLEREQHKRREVVVHRLHDDVANRLSYTLLRLRKDGSSGSTADLDEIAGDVSEALRNTRRAVNVLSGNGEPESNPPEPAASGIASSAWSELRETVTAASARLERVGVAGTVLMPETATVGLDREGFETLRSFIGECFANIAKHAEPERGYVLSVNGRPTGIVVSLTDTPSRPPETWNTSDPSESTGKGLAYYRRFLERSGGSLRIGRDGEEWSMTAVFPAPVADGADG